MNNSTIRKSLVAMLAAIATSAILSAHASNFTITSTTSGSTTKFIVSRNDTTAAETVNLRTVPLSAYPGQHFTAKSGTLTFAAGQSAVTNTVTEGTPTSNAYKFQNGGSRSYRFELTDAGGFLITTAMRTITTGFSVPSSGLYSEKSATIDTTAFTVNDDGYKQSCNPRTFNRSSFYTDAANSYLFFLSAQLRMTLEFQAKEKDDAYEYFQLIVNNTTNCDSEKDANKGDPGTPILSYYMAGFEIDTGNTYTTYKTYTFPITSVGSGGSADNPWGYGTGFRLSKQRFKSNCQADDGKIIIPAGFDTLSLRFDASGSSGSNEWEVKNIKAKITAYDTAAPTVLDVSAAPGIHAKGNDIYVSVAFSEIVTVTGSPSLTTSWGTLNYFSGSGSNVLTFKGTIPDTASGALEVTGKSGTIKDLADNALSGNIAANNRVSLTANHTYSITYDLAGGSLPDGASNHDTYTYESDEFTLAPPIRPSYTFAGWTGTGISGLTNSVTVATHSHGDRAYVANWTPITYFVHFDPGDGTGAMREP